MRTFILSLLLLLIATPVFGQDVTVETLQEDLKVYETKLKNYRTEFERLKNIGYGGPTLRKDLEVLGTNVAGVIEEIESINRQLVKLTEADAGEPVLSIKTSMESYDGPPVSGTLTTGDIIALQGEAEMPGEKGDLRKATLTWQLVDEAGKQVGEYFKQEDIWGMGVTLKTKVRFLINEMDSGKYTALLTYTPDDNPSDTTETRADFEVSRALVVKDIWVTDKPGGRPVKTLKSDKEPYFYVTFEVEEEIKAVTVQLSAKNEATGEHLTLDVVDYKIKPDKKEQRTGIMLQEYALEGVNRIRFEALFELPDGKRISVDKSVSIMQDEYELILRAAPTILSGEKGPFTIRLPEGFIPPYKVKFHGDDLSVSNSGNPLKGMYSGKARGKDVVATLTANVTDAEGRQAEGSATVTIKAENAAVAQSKIKPTLHSKSSKSSSKSKHSQYFNFICYFGSNYKVYLSSDYRSSTNTIKINVCGVEGYVSPGGLQRFREKFNYFNNKYKLIKGKISFSGNKPIPCDPNSLKILSQ